MNFVLDQKSCIINFDEKHSVTLELIPSSVTNKFEIITSFIERLSAHFGQEFDKWFKKFITEYNKKVEGRYDIVIKNIPKIRYYVDKYIEDNKIDFTQFVDESKAKKTSILFSADEVEKIAKISNYMKIYAIISNSKNLKLDQRLHRKAYNEIISSVSNSDIVFKIFNVIKTKTFIYNLTDKYMWDYIRMIQCKTIDVHVIEIFNFIMNSILVLCEENKNPITYFVSVVEESIKWFLRSVYKGSIIYDDTVSTEDLHGPNIDNLKTYSYNDTLGRLKDVALGQMHTHIEKPLILLFEKEAEHGKSLIELHERLSSVNNVSPLCECLVYPILSIITGVPYNHFKTISPEHSVLLSFYVQGLMRKVFKNDYKNIVSLLNYYTDSQPALVTTYKMKAIHDYLNITNDLKNFYGFNTKIIPHKIISYFIGRISRVKFTDIFTGRELSGIPLSKIEQEMIQFYTALFAGKFNSEFEKMRKIMNIDF